MTLLRGKPAAHPRLAAAALVLVTAAAALRASSQTQTPPPAVQQAPPAGQQPAVQQAPPAGQQTQAQPQQPAQQQPVFRAGVKLVRVDVSVTGKGEQPVADLTPGDFDVAEDGVPQKVEQLQFIRLSGQRPTGDEESLEIRSEEQAEAEAARDDVRVFAIFFDDYHVDKAPQITIPMRQALTLFINRLWPSDLVVLMDPLTPLSALRFTRSKPELLAAINKLEGRQGEIFPVKSVMEEAQLMRGDIRRVRAEVTLSALGALTMKLGGLKEGRKSILFLSQGPPTYLGSRDGNLQDEIRTIVEAANRGNVAIYPLDPTGLSMEMRLGDKGTLYQLAAETGGRTIVNTNNFAGGLDHVFTDNTAYYVLGYPPTRTEDDGKYHKITVKVKRPGTRVLARQGYFAPSAKELTRAAEASAKTLEPHVASALDTLAQQRPGKRPVDVWVGLARGPDGRTRVTVSWDPVAPASSGLVTSVDVEVLSVAAGAAVASRTIPAPVAGKAARTAESFELPPGSFNLSFTVHGEDRTVVDNWTQQFAAPDWSRLALGMSTPRFYRAQSLQEFRALQAAADPAPIATRQFSRSDRVLIAVECYTSNPGALPRLEAHIQTREGRELAALPVPALEEGRVRFELPVGSLGQGTYILRLRAALGSDQVEQLTAVRIER